ncbi:SDR family NAD(P)-dependent oxidoreductase, partial [Streptomyces harbinensis]|uniref:SDR family NAD(P)-dependent oxidoreductase n=1 Tax=Streptomyces harbinensis TaxID=1176198 RepID=UPI0034DF4FC1
MDGNTFRVPRQPGRHPAHDRHRYRLLREGTRMRTRNNVVVITGASSGVGRACAQRFAARGWTVVLAG